MIYAEKWSAKTLPIPKNQLDKKSYGHNRWSGILVDFRDAMLEFEKKTMLEDFIVH